MTDVYVAGSLHHMPREWWGIYEKIGEVVKDFGLKVYVPHVRTPKDIGQSIEVIMDSTNNDLHGVHKDIFHTCVARVEGSKLIIAEVSNPSLGSGIELGIALKANKPIICLANKKATVTPLIMGATQSGLAYLIRYESEEDALRQLKSILEGKFMHLVSQ